MTSRWDGQAISMIRDMAADLTALDAAVEVLKAGSPSDQRLLTIDHLVKQCVSRQVDLLNHLKG
ncbi:MAG TPA: hypothetical protein VGD57_08815 [Candidatus Dormibacteraeota bacterium]|jgi:hypothetical protein